MELLVDLLEQAPEAAELGAHRAQQVPDLVGALLDREGAAGPADVALVGNESQVRDQIAALKAMPDFGSPDRVRAAQPGEAGSRSGITGRSR